MKNKVMVIFYNDDNNVIIHTFKDEKGTECTIEENRRDTRDYHGNITSSCVNYNVTMNNLKAHDITYEEMDKIIADLTECRNRLLK